MNYQEVKVEDEVKKEEEEVQNKMSLDGPDIQVNRPQQLERGEDISGYFGKYIGKVQEKKEDKMVDEKN